MQTASGVTLDEHGAQLFEGFATAILGSLLNHLTGYDLPSPGSRIASHPALAELLANVRGLAGIASTLAGRAVRPVRAVFFDKSESNNWALGWHQDRTICVRQRHDIAGFEPWTMKQGLQHVQPPFEFINGMITLRIHFDAVDTENAPLLVAVGSHRFGLIPVPEIPAAVERCRTLACMAAPGDVWAYATPIVHSSERSRSFCRRRVLQVDYSGDDLPDPLRWLGI
ncbi:MAG: phytanoyl-CoA dioxygenase family protein [Novosphingobium sp.]